MEYRTLGKTGLKVSALGFGASSLGGGVFRAVEESEAIRTVHIALDLGINIIDVSPFYGYTRAETVLGKALKGISRDKYYLATKVGRYGDEEFDFSAKRTTASIEESLARIGVDYVDIIQSHDNEYGNLDQVVNETIPALRKLQQDGKARFVGVTGYPLKIFRYLLERVEVDTILSYNHYSLNDTTLLGLLSFLESKSTGVISASPVSQGLLTSQGTPAWHPASDKVKQVCMQAASYCREQGSDISKLAMQFAVANPRIATTLVGTASPTNISKNVQWIQEPLDQALLGKVQDILRPIQDETWIVGKPENN
ncbi:MAG: aldo/keto reductase [Acidobacteria bacterium]|nr:aldo/keto reductase [Acidobacteriota bacterium]